MAFKNKRKLEDILDHELTYSQARELQDERRRVRHEYQSSRKIPLHEILEDDKLETIEFRWRWFMPKTPIKFCDFCNESWTHQCEKSTHSLRCLSVTCDKHLDFIYCTECKLTLCKDHYEESLTHECYAECDFCSKKSIELDFCTDCLKNFCKNCKREIGAIQCESCKNYSCKNCEHDCDD